MEKNTQMVWIATSRDAELEEVTRDDVKTPISRRPVVKRSDGLTVEMTRHKTGAIYQSHRGRGSCMGEEGRLEFLGCPSTVLLFHHGCVWFRNSVSRHFSQVVISCGWEKKIVLPFLVIFIRSCVT